MVTQTGNSFTPELADSALVAACDEAGIESRGAELVRIGSNAVYRLPAEIVARVARPSAAVDGVVQQVDVARWLEREDYPATRALPVRQPVAGEGCLVTFWRSVSDVEEYASIDEVARLILWLHELGEPGSLRLPEATPMADLRSRLAAADNLDTASARYFNEQAERIYEQYERLAFPLPTGTVHGDANVGNVIRSKSGAPTLIDLDNFAHGHREWDLVQTALFYERFGWHTKDEYDAFCEVYGFDIMQWEGYPVLADYREVYMTLWLAGKVGETPGVEDEVRKRIHSMQTGTGRDEWAPF